MSAGTRILRFEVDSDSDKKNWLYSLNYFLISRSQTTSLEDNESLPDKITLEANFPNPFNPNTTLSFALPESMPVRLEVFTTTGQLVATLVDAPMTSGTHHIDFRADQLASGLYLYRLTTPNGTLIRKMTLLK
jgi:hypothetical protein